MLLPGAQIKLLALLPTMLIIFLCVAYNAEKYSNFSPCVFFCDVAYTAEKKIIGVIENNAENCLNLNISTNLKPYANLR